MSRSSSTQHRARRGIPLGTPHASLRAVHRLFSPLALLALGLASASACTSSRSTSTPCDVSCGDFSDNFPLALPCGETIPTALTVTGPCALGSSGTDTTVTFTDNGTCTVTASFPDHTTETTVLSRQPQAPVPGQCCSPPYAYTGLAGLGVVQLGVAPCSDGGGFFVIDAGSDASDDASDGSTDASED